MSENGPAIAPHAIITEKEATQKYHAWLRIFCEVRCHRCRTVLPSDRRVTYFLLYPWVPLTSLLWHEIQVQNKKACSIFVKRLH
jgi:hypothetical protein